MKPVVIGSGSLRLGDLIAVARERAPVLLDPDAVPRLEHGRAALETIDRSGEALYGVTTGVGKLKDTVIPAAERRQLQRNLVLSHAAGVGAPLGESNVGVRTRTDSPIMLPHPKRKRSLSWWAVSIGVHLALAITIAWYSPLRSWLFNPAPTDQKMPSVSRSRMNQITSALREKYQRALKKSADELAVTHREMIRLQAKRLGQVNQRSG